MDPTNSNLAGAAANPRRLAGLVAFLGRQDSLKFEDLDFTHPLLAGATMAEIMAAMEELVRRSNDELGATYAHWMGGADTFSVGKRVETDWMPIVKMRYLSFLQTEIVAARAAMVWSPADVWLVHYFNYNPTRGQGVTPRGIYYAYQSLISKEDAVYGCAIPAPHRIRNLNNVRLPPKRPFMGLMNEDLCALMNNQEKAPVVSADMDHPLHQFIISTFRTTT